MSHTGVRPSVGSEKGSEQLAKLLNSQASRPARACSIQHSAFTARHLHESLRYPARACHVASSGSKILMGISRQSNLLAIHCSPRTQDHLPARSWTMFSSLLKAEVGLVASIYINLESTGLMVRVSTAQDALRNGELGTMLSHWLCYS